MTPPFAHELLAPTSPLIMMAGGAKALLIILGVCAGLGIFLLPSIIASRRKHSYLWIIVVLNVIGGLFAGLGWVAALIWAVWPSDKSMIDPLVGNPTGTGLRNAGDTLGGAGYGTMRGFEAERALTNGGVQVASEPVTTSATKVCPDCAETVKAPARLCRYCSHQFA